MTRSNAQLETVQTEAKGMQAHVEVLKAAQNQTRREVLYDPQEQTLLAKGPLRVKLVSRRFAETYLSIFVVLLRLVRELSFRETMEVRGEVFYLVPATTQENLLKDGRGLLRFLARGVWPKS